jgi:hypothetical protein
MDLSYIKEGKRTVMVWFHSSDNPKLDKTNLTKNYICYANLSVRNYKYVFAVIPEEFSQFTLKGVQFALNKFIELGFPYKYQIVTYHKKWYVVIRIRRGKRAHRQMLQILTPLRYFTEFGYFPELQRAVLSYKTIKNPNLSILDRLLFFYPGRYPTGHSLSSGNIDKEKLKHYTCIKSISRGLVNRSVHSTYLIKKKRSKPLHMRTLIALEKYKTYPL